MPFTGLVKTPDELGIVQRVFDAIVAEPWFDHAEGNDRRFAAWVLRAYREGVSDYDRLHRYCREVAAVNFSMSP